jgi:uncharacterized protein (TIGR02996 family)
MEGYRGEPWAMRGLYLYDRDGFPFASLLRGAEEFGETIIWCVNLLTGVPIRDTDGTPTPEQVVALALLQNRPATRLPDMIVSGQEAGFLKAICSGDTFAVLAWSDWLSERGDPRGQAIRTGVRALAAEMMQQPARE